MFLKTFHVNSNKYCMNTDFEMMLLLIGFWYNIVESLFMKVLK